MKSRRRFIQATAMMMGGMLATSAQAETAIMADNDEWFMPDEGDLHTRTWMAFGASEKIWGRKLLPEVQRNLATIAKTIARYEPVSMLVRKREYDLARKLVGATVDLIVAEIDDLWVRDTGAVFVVTEQGKKAAINFNFNGWGKKQVFSRDAKVADFIAQRAGVKTIATELVLEGGGIEVDGHGTAIITESCTLNANRNPRVTKAAFEAELKDLLGLEKIIWLPGIKGRDITDGHTDFYARFVRPGVIVAGLDPDPKSFDHAVTKKHLEILQAAKDVEGRQLEVVVLEAPSSVRKGYETDDFAAGYINFYVCNGAVIAPEFGDARTDGAAKKKLQNLFPQREIVQINIDGIAAGGGGIHCTTQQEPKG